MGSFVLMWVYFNFYKEGIDKLFLYKDKVVLGRIFKFYVYLKV